MCEANDENYGTKMERNLFNVACTRAMRVLVLTHVGPATRFMPDRSLHELACS